MAWTQSVVRDVLPNGLTVLVQRAPSAAVVAVVTHVRAGYFDEPDEWVGIAHVLEHMFFKGTATRGPGELARATQLLGGYLNAGTIYDKTVYYTVVPSAGDGLARAVDLQADALMHATLDRDDLSREIEVIVQEAKRKLDTPAAVTHETLYALLFAVHRMRRWRIGTEEGLRQLTAEDLRRYYRTRYAPDRVIVSLAGDLDPDRALNLARSMYGDWTVDREEVEGSPEEPSHRAEGAVRVLRGDIERPIAALGWRTVGTMHADAPALEMAATILGAGRASWLAQQVRRPGLAGAIGSSHFTPTEVGVFEVSMAGDVGKLGDAVARSLDVVGGLGETPPDATQLERARALMATQWARRFESVDGRATSLAEFEALGSVELADAYFDRLMAVTAGEIRDAAERHLRREHACAALYLPSSAATPALATTWPPRAAGNGVPRSVVPAALAGVAVAGGEQHEVGEGVHHLAADGVDLLVSAKRGSGLVAVGVYLPGVVGRETRGDAGISWLLARSSLRGAAGLSADELAAAAERLGGGIRAAVGSETLGWGITVRADAIGEAIALLRAVVAAPTLETDEMLIERSQQADDAARARDDMFDHPLSQVLGQAFPEDAYGLPRLGDPEGLLAVTPERVRQWGRHLRRARPVVVAVGDLDRAALLDGVAQFGTWPTAVANGEWAVPAWVAGRSAERREKAQSALAMAFPAPTVSDPARFAARVAGAVLSGMAGRLFEELRERRSLAYTVHAGPWARHRAGAMLTYIATSPEREEEARDAMLAELARLTEDPPAAGELERAVNYAAGLVAIRRQHARTVVVEIADAWLAGTIAELHREEDQLRAVGREDVIAVCRATFDPSRRAEYVVRGVAKAR
ncbi:MAG TPA: pitrilysin family protein [Gemmatimonadales bacterium]